MPLVAMTVECPQCAVAFLAPHRSPSNAVQCPHCGTQSALQHCREVGANDAFEQERITDIRTSEEESREVLERSRGQQLKLLLIFGGLVAVLGVGAYAAVSYGSRQQLNEMKEEQAQTEMVAAADKQRYDAAFSVAKSALGATDWRAMLGQVRVPERARSMAEWVYDRRPYEAFHLTDYQFPQEINLDGNGFVRLFVKAEEVDRGFWIRLEEGASGWLLDWEALGRYTREHWDYFYEERPTTREQYRVHIQLSSLPDRHFFERGFTGDGDALAVRIWSLEGGKDVHSVLSKQSEMGSRLAGELNWTVGEGYIVDLQWPSESSVDSVDSGYRFVDLVRIVQAGWHAGDKVQTTIAAH